MTTIYTNEKLAALGYAQSEFDLARLYCEARDRFNEARTESPEELKELGKAFDAAKNALYDFQSRFGRGTTVTRA